MNTPKDSGLAKVLPASSASIARRTLLPRFVVTQTASPSTPGAQRVAVPVSDVTPEGCYYVQPVMLEGASERRDGKPRWVPFQTNLFPVVLDADGSPWAEANLYLMLRFENTVNPVLTTFAATADDLAAFRRFLITYQLDWTLFPSSKLNRPTYRYNAHLRLSVMAGEIAASTAKRRMSTVVSFYRWLKELDILKPAYEPWKESDRFIVFKDAYGLKASKRVLTTDVAIRTPTQEDPYAGTLDDGGKLRPLPEQEQHLLCGALKACDNPEMTLIFLVAWLTGARIQTVLTLRLRHFAAVTNATASHEVRIPVGPGTGVDTKGDKLMVLHFPAWFYKRLHVYAYSERSKLRRLKATGGDYPDQYLFLSLRGAPLYQSKQDASIFDPSAELHHAKAGQAVRQFISERVLPQIRACIGTECFHFQFHDLRATYGMNLTDVQLELVKKGEISLHQAREYVKTRMCHSSANITDRYLQFRQYQAQVRYARTQYETRLQALAESADGGSRC
jgi:integrase